MEVVLRSFDETPLQFIERRQQVNTGEIARRFGLNVSEASKLMHALARSAKVIAVVKAATDAPLMTWAEEWRLPSD